MAMFIKIVQDYQRKLFDNMKLFNQIEDVLKKNPDEIEAIESDEADDRDEVVASEYAIKYAVEAIEAATEIIEMENLDADDAVDEISDFYGDDDN
jgi:CHASE3 domain sensor protein